MMTTPGARQLEGPSFDNDDLKRLMQLRRDLAGREAYRTLGLLGTAKPANEYTPADFAEKKALALLKGALGREVMLKAES